MNDSIVLKDRDGNPQTHEGVNSIRMVSANGEVVDFVNAADAPMLMENVPITPDFSNGHQYFSAPDGMAVKSAIVQKPEDLIPANIAEGVNIAGIIGALPAGGNIKIASGYILGNSFSSGKLTHNLGVKPDILVVFLQSAISSGDSNVKSSKLMDLIYLSQEFAAKCTSAGFGDSNKPISFVTGGSPAYIRRYAEMTVTETYIQIPYAPATAYYYNFVAIGGLT